MVPMDVPVAKDRIQAMMNTSTGSSPGVRNCSNRDDRYSPVPRVFTIGDKVKANMSIAAIESIDEAPLNTLSMNCPKVYIFCTIVSMPQIIRATKTPHSRACMPFPLRRLPSPVTIRATITPAIIPSIGRSRFIILGLSVSICISSSPLLASGLDLGSSRYPVSAALFSAFFIGPKSIPSSERTRHPTTAITQ